MSRIVEEMKQHLNGDDPAFGSIDAERLMSWAEEIGIQLSSDEVDVSDGENRSEREDISKNQLRKFYDAVKLIERRTLRLKSDKILSDKVIAQLLFLRPHLANAQRKNPRNRKIKLLCDVLNPCLASNVIEKKADLTRFVKFFEAIVAYTG